MSDEDYRLTEKDKRKCVWVMIVFGFVCSVFFYEKSAPNIQKILAVVLCATTSIMPIIMYVFTVKKDKSDWFCEQITGESRDSVIVGIAFFCSRQLDILVRPELYPHALQAIIYIAMIVVFSVAYTLTREAGMFEYLFDQINRFGKESSVEVEKLMSLDLWSSSDGRNHIRKRRHPAGMLSVCILFLIITTYTNTLIFEMITCILAMFLFIRVFFILDNDMRCDLRDNFIILKNAEQESQYLAIKDGFARKIKSKKLSIRVMLLFYFIVCAIYIHRLGIAIHQ